MAQVAVGEQGVALGAVGEQGVALAVAQALAGELERAEGQELVVVEEQAVAVAPAAGVGLAEGPERALQANG